MGREEEIPVVLLVLVVRVKSRCKSMARFETGGQRVHLPREEEYIPYLVHGTCFDTAYHLNCLDVRDECAHGWHHEAKDLV